jgi:hypothetical protein
VFPVRYELDFYILFRRNSVFKGLKKAHFIACKPIKTSLRHYTETNRIHNRPGFVLENFIKKQGIQVSAAGILL